MMRPLLAVLLLCSPCLAEEISGRVVSIADGDTLTILVDKQQIKVRLAGIDAPESKQPFGTKAKEHLGTLAHEKTAVVKVTGKDRYRRTLGVVLVDGQDVNAAMVRSGMAWNYVRFSKSAELARLETEARTAKRGLWSDPSPVPPWEWRKNSTK